LMAIRASLRNSPNRSGARSMSTPESSDPHHGTFASGESSPEIYPDEKEVGTFASGEANPEAYPDDKQVGPTGRS
jgi:hypothetical protein